MRLSRVFALMIALSSVAEAKPVVVHDVHYLKSRMFQLFTDAKYFATEIEINGQKIPGLKQGLSNTRTQDPKTHERVSSDDFISGGTNGIILNSYLRAGANQIVVRLTPSLLAGHTWDYYVDPKEEGMFSRDEIGAFAALVEGPLTTEHIATLRALGRAVRRSDGTAKFRELKTFALENGSQMKPIEWKMTLTIDKGEAQFEAVSLRTCEWQSNLRYWQGKASLNGIVAEHSEGADRWSGSTQTASWLKKGANKLELVVTALPKERASKAVAEFSVRCDLERFKKDLHTDADLGDFFSKMTLPIVSVAINRVGKHSVLFSYSE